MSDFIDDTLKAARETATRLFDSLENSLSTAKPKTDLQDENDQLKLRIDKLQVEVDDLETAIKLLLDGEVKKVITTTLERAAAAQDWVLLVDIVNHENVVNVYFDQVKGQSF